MINRQRFANFKMIITKRYKLAKIHKSQNNYYKTWQIGKDSQIQHNYYKAGQTDNDLQISK